MENMKSSGVAQDIQIVIIRSINNFWTTCPKVADGD